MRIKRTTLAAAIACTVAGTVIGWAAACVAAAAYGCQPPTDFGLLIDDLAATVATCRCRHRGDDHDAGECWETVDGQQCPCSWYVAELGDEAADSGC